MGNTLNKDKIKINYKKVPLNDPNDEKTTKEMKQVVEFESEMTTFGEKTKKIKIEMDHNEFVKIFMDPKVELMIGDLSYLIGYKMALVVDEYRRKIPGVVAIVTMKINNHENVIFQSEKSTGHNKKEMYELLDLSKKIAPTSNYSREQQADSLIHIGGNKIAWEHSTKYCAHNVEPLAVTFCGKFGNVITACKKYDKGLAFVESAYTYQEQTEPVIYEVGNINKSQHDRPSVGKGGCLDFFHFFLRAQYAIDYGYWEFQMNAENGNVDNTEIVFGKGFDSLRKVDYNHYDGNVTKKIGAKLVPTPNGYMANSLIETLERDQNIHHEMNNEVDNIALLLEQELSGMTKKLDQNVLRQRKVATN